MVLRGKATPPARDNQQRVPPVAYYVVRDEGGPDRPTMGMLAMRGVADGDAMGARAVKLALPS